MHRHEAWDGSGYPRGLAGEDIPLEARILTIADGYDALTAPSYRAAMPGTDALAILAREQGRLIDPQVVGAFLGLLGESGNAA